MNTGRILGRVASTLVAIALLNGCGGASAPGRGSSPTASSSPGFTTRAGDLSLSFPSDWRVERLETREACPGESFVCTAANLSNVSIASESARATEEPIEGFFPDGEFKIEISINRLEEGDSMEAWLAECRAQQPPENPEDSSTLDRRVGCEQITIAGQAWLHTRTLAKTFDPPVHTLDLDTIANGVAYRARGYVSTGSQEARGLREIDEIFATFRIHKRST